MKVKLTPLNIVSAACLVFGIFILWEQGPEMKRPLPVSAPGLLAGFCLISAAVFFVSDLVFRKFVPSLMKLWAIEGVLIVFMIVLVYILVPHT